MQTRTQAAALDLGPLGIWSAAPRLVPPERAVEAAQEMESLGFQTLWLPGLIDGGVLDTMEAVLAGTNRLKVASGILNIWKHEPADVGAWWAGQSPSRQARTLVGIGVSHGPIIGAAYQRPLEKVAAYLDALEAAQVPRERLCVAALGPKMLQLGAARTAGVHPYLVTPEHTAEARATIGALALLAPEQGVVLERDPHRAREIARAAVAMYTAMPNYRNSWLRLGFTEDDINTMSDRFIDKVVAWGDLDVIQGRVRAHLDAGADHVCLQVLTGAMGPDALEPERDAWRELAKLL